MLAADIFDDYRSVVYIAVAVIYVLAQMGALIKRKPQDKAEKPAEPAPEPRPARRAETAGEARRPSMPQRASTPSAPPPVPPSAQPETSRQRPAPPPAPARPTRTIPPAPARPPRRVEPPRRPASVATPPRAATQRPRAAPEPARPAPPPPVESAVGVEGEPRAAREFREARQHDNVAGEISAGLLNFGPRAASEQLRRFQALTRSRRAVQQAFVLSELLAPPVALRGPDEGAPGLR